MRKNIKIVTLFRIMFILTRVSCSAFLSRGSSLSLKSLNSNFSQSRFIINNSIIPFKRTSQLLFVSSSNKIASSSTDENIFKKNLAPMKINLHSIHEDELKSILKNIGYPAFRASQVLHWVREQGVKSFDEMNNIPKKLRAQLSEIASLGSLDIAMSQESKDGTLKRAYRLHDGHIIESVLMPYEDGRNTACISSQAGCAMGCVFCATGQAGFARQLTSEEIFEQVSLFASELKRVDQRLSNIVFMGMGEPLANYQNVMTAIRRINTELGIGARKITVSTVGLVPNIYKLMQEKEQVRLAISLHCTNDKERTDLIPANRRYGGLDALMTSVKDYTETTKRRITFEWALIEGVNDSLTVARELGDLITKKHNIKPGYCHVNIIPLNPTGGYGGSAAGRKKLKAFAECLDKEFSISASPRMRRGIDIDAGCGQLKSKLENEESMNP